MAVAPTSHQPAIAADEPKKDMPWPSERAGFFALFCIIFATFLTFFDQMVFSMLAEKMKQSFGLSDSALGFVLGPAPILAAIRTAIGAWPVSAGAIAIGTAAYRDRSWIEAMRTQLHAEAAALDAMLVRTGHRPAGACPLIRLLEVPDDMALFERLARCAILTRPFADRLRIGLPRDQAGRARLEAALADG